MAKSKKCVFVVQSRKSKKHTFPTSINGWNKAATKLDKLAHDDTMATLALQCTAPGGHHDGKDEVVIATGMRTVRFDVGSDTFNRDLSEDPDRSLFGRARRRR